MSTDTQTVQITMPQAGESVTEGTVLEWRKGVGDRVEEGEPLVEISTDKVDAELPSPVAGTLVEILAEPDEVVQAGSVVARIEVGEDGRRGTGDGRRARTAARRLPARRPSPVNPGRAGDGDGAPARSQHSLAAP